MSDCAYCYLRVPTGVSVFFRVSEGDYWCLRVPTSV